MDSRPIDWVGRDEAIACPDADWLSDNWLTCFVTESSGLVVMESTIPLACGPGLIFGSKLDIGAFRIISYKSQD